jgi:hypothetical protein
VHKVDSLFGSTRASARLKGRLLLVVVAAAHGGLRHDYLAHGLVLEHGLGQVVLLLGVALLVRLLCRLVVG